jgi:polar amino acid transport system substrate-binding protein
MRKGKSFGDPGNITHRASDWELPRVDRRQRRSAGGDRFAPSTGIMMRLLDRRAVGACCLALALCACGLPRDADGTLDRVREHELRVGISEHPPWTVFANESIGGIEPRLVGELASELRTRAVWRRGAESELLEALHKRELDLVVAGLTDDSPWTGTVAFTRPHFTDTVAQKRHVFAVAPGENAFLVRVERFLQPRERTGSLAPEGTAR